MTKDDIIQMAREAWNDAGEGWVVHGWFEDRFKALERFAQLVAAAERERIKQANAPEIERCNEYIKSLEDAVASEREACEKRFMQVFLDPENQPTQFGTATQEYRKQEIKAEREACAKLADEIDPVWESISDAIRARGQQ